MSPSDAWIDALRVLLCRIYEEWGGDCAELGFGATEWIDTLQGEYDTNGAPAFPGETERQAYLDLLSETEGHLDNSANTLNQADNLQLRTLIGNLESDVEAQGT